MGGNVDEESAPREVEQIRVTGATGRSRWPRVVLKPLGGFAFELAKSILHDEHEARDIAQAVLAALVARADPPRTLRRG